ncbi:MAG: ATP-binding protein [Conexivisphaera sp.]
MRLIGRIADGATETSARLILLKDMENVVTAEELVLVMNGGDQNPIGKVLGVLREGLGKNEFLEHSSYRPDVAYMRHGGEPSGAREVYSFAVKPIGVVDGDLEPNRHIIKPRSPVYLLEDQDEPMRMIAAGRDVIWTNAHVEGHPGWRVPVDPAYIPYHVGIYGSTGSGKSWLARNILVPLYRAAGYGVLILDWSGTDYAPHYPGSVVSVSDIALDEESVVSYLRDRTGGFARNDAVGDAVDEFAVGWIDKVRDARGRAEKEGRPPEEILLEELASFVDKRVQSIRRDDWKDSALRAFRRSFRRLAPRDLRPVMGTRPMEELVDSVRGNGVLVLDMSGVTSEAKLGIFLSLGRRLEELMEEGRDLRIALVVDEAPQYAPWNASGIQLETTEMIRELAALGRKRGLNLTLIAQGIKGDIGINAAVRRNLNTHFFGRIHPLDAGGEGGASEWLSPYGIHPDAMLQLKPGRFYFSGAMNPSPVPILITYEPQGA